MLVSLVSDRSSTSVACRPPSVAESIALLICLSQKIEWSGLVLSGAMCGVAEKFTKKMTLIVCDASSARRVFEMARNKDKAKKILLKMRHQLVGKNGGVGLAFGMIFDWILDLANVAHSKKYLSSRVAHSQPLNTRDTSQIDLRATCTCS
ncbi:hypothetical protein MRB53_011167 [Persea americana]|uniref:Uncharacterized protein n=1 Tax=Persea americana TaxID=3435 RepID=A0ACC2LU01_PERAE|nr:hypothetical protein MRB53_011167 [Persea americana]